MYFYVLKQTVFELLCQFYHLTNLIVILARFLSKQFFIQGCLFSPTTTPPYYQSSPEPYKITPATGKKKY